MRFHVLVSPIGSVVAAAEYEAQQESGGETADVRHIGDTSARAGAERSRILTENLNHYPEAKHDDGRKLDRRPKESQRQQGSNAIAREHDKVGAEHAGYRARCSQRWDRRIRVDEYVGERRRESAY